MDKLKQWIALTVLGALVIAGAGWFLLISPKRSEAAEIREQVASQESKNSALRTQISLLKAQAKQLPAKQAQLAAVAAKIPNSPDLPTLIRALSVAADEAGVELVSIAPTPPTDVELPAAAPVAGAAPATGAAARPAAAAVAPASVAGVLQQIGLSLSVVGGYFQVGQFLDELESLTRAVKVKQLALAPGGVDPTKIVASGAQTSPEKNLATTITATVYMAKGRITVAPVTAPAAGK